MLTRKRFILLYAGIFLLFGIPYAVHLSNYYSVKNRIEKRNSKYEQEFDALKKKLKTSFVSEHGSDLDFFDHYYSLNKAISYTDTTVSFFIYWDRIKIKHFDLAYLSCLETKANTAALNHKADIQLEKALNTLRNKYGDDAKLWIRRIGKNRFLNSYRIAACDNYFTEDKAYQFDPKSISDFERFLEEVHQRELVLEIESELDKLAYENRLKELKKELNEFEYEKLKRNLEEQNAFQTSEKRFRFSGNGLGNFDYYLSYDVYNERTLEAALEFYYTEKYRFNSLKTGDMPYAYCYGGRNFGTSYVEVTNGSGDVLVTMKNMNDVVVRHVYIASFDTYTLRVPPGNYQVFFYYGSGWNPKKFMKNTICGTLKGGFISGSFVQKDPDIIPLKAGGGMTYKLRKTSGGNFSTEGSSTIEAF